MIYNTNFTLCSHNTDFEPRHRDEIIDYIIERFGREYVVNIGTFGIARTKVAIQDVGRVFGIPAQETLTVTKALGDEVDEDAPFSDAIEACPELKAYLEKWEKEGENEELKPISDRVEWKIRLKNLRYYIESVKGNARNMCLPKDHLVNTSNGKKEISKLDPSIDKIEYLNSKQEIKTTNNFKLINTGTQIVYKITLEDGKILRATENHVI